MKRGARATAGSRRLWVDPRDEQEWTVTLELATRRGCVLTFRGEHERYRARFAVSKPLAELSDDELIAMLESSKGADGSQSGGRLLSRDTTGPITVEVREVVDCEPIDLDAWVRRYVRMVLELEGVVPVETPDEPPLP